MAAAKKSPGLRVVAARDGFRRAGRAWSKDATDVALANLTKDQIAQLKSEPLLAVSEVDIASDAE